MKWIIIGLLGLVPVWRDPGWSGGVNAYEAIYNFATRQKEHIGVEQALEECRQAYQVSHQSLLHSA